MAAWFCSAAMFVQPLLQFKCTDRVETCHCLQIIQMRKWCIYNTQSHWFQSLFLVVTIDCYQCLMILIVGMCMGFNMIRKFFVTILCFALKHNSEACIVTILWEKKTLPIWFIACWLFETMHVQSRDISIRLLGKVFAYLWRRRLN